MTDEHLTDLAEDVLRLLPAECDGTVRATRVRHGLTRFAGSAIHQHVAEDTVTVHLRVLVGSRAASASTTRGDPASLERLVADTVALARLRPPDPDRPAPAPRAEVAHHDHVAPTTIDASPEDRTAEVARFVAAGDGGTDAAGYVDTGVTAHGIATTAGQRAAAAATRATVDGIHRLEDAAGMGHHTARSLRDIDAGRAGRTAADLARRASADPVDIRPGDYPVVLGPECVGTIATFLGMYGFNAKRHQEGQSFVSLGAQQLDAAISLADDVGDPRSCGIGVDVEGTPRQRVPLIQDGVCTALVHDRRTAVRAGVDSTGHAVEGGETVGPTATDLVVGSGQSSPDDLVADVDRGLLITSFNYCRTLDPKTLVVTGLTRNGTFLIRNGEITAPVSDLRFTQSFAEALAPGRVLGIGGDARYTASEFAAGTVIAPSMRLAGWRITGGPHG